MIRLIYPIFVMAICVVCATAQTPTPSPQPSPAAVTTPGSVSLQDYREILNNERKLLEDQSEKYYGRIDTLINRATLAIAIALGIILFIIGKTRSEAKALVHELFEKQVSSSFQSEIDNLKSLVRDLKTEVEDLKAFQKQSVVWVFSGADVKGVEQEFEALYATGLQNIETVAPTKAEEVELGNPDLVIFSYDGTEEGQKRLTKVVAKLKEQAPPVSLLIYTYNREGPEIRLGEAEKEILKGFLWHEPANFPATLVAKTQLLIRTRRKL